MTFDVLLRNDYKLNLVKAVPNCDGSDREILI